MGKKKRFIESHRSKKDAEKARDSHAQTLKNMGKTPKTTVSVERIKGAAGYGVYLHEENGDG